MTISRARGDNGRRADAWRAVRRTPGIGGSTPHLFANRSRPEDSRYRQKNGRPEGRHHGFAELGANDADAY